MDSKKIIKELVKKDFGAMNDRQFEAVTTVNGPLLVLAGAGSGKTTVLVNRIAYLCKYGNAYNSDVLPEYPEYLLKSAEEYINGGGKFDFGDAFAVDAPKPYEILAITFTNKAAGELKSRIAAKLGAEANDVWAGTFHSICGKILRRNADLLGYSSHFTIYDSDDQKRLIKDIMKKSGIEEKMFPPSAVLSLISGAKDSLISPEEYEHSIGNDLRLKTVSKLYKIYQKELKSNDAMDFDDMINQTVRLLKENPDVLNYYGNKFKYICVDEYQDTNHAQYVLVSLLSSIHNNICVVGDDDQSIYRFRGATIENILSFEDTYKNSKVIRLEQNYRSTGNILNAANGVIKNNKGRKGKTLWTEKGDGDLISVKNLLDERDEAKFVAETVLDKVNNGEKFSDNAVLYRLNAQSQAIENAFVRSGIPYVVIGGNRFYDRKEIRDVLAYLNVILNPNDNVRLKRIINEPKRGIGETTINNASTIADNSGLSLFEVISSAEDYPAISKAATKLKDFSDMINSLSALSGSLTISELFSKMLEKTGYVDALRSDLTDPKNEDRIDNVKEFQSTIKNFEDEADVPTLSTFLEEIALVSDIDSMNESDDKAVLMTVHSAKGLEFNNVYLVGMEDGIFPSSRSFAGGEYEIEEERRLAYVAITRAKKHLYITTANMRMMYGQTTRNLQSRFLSEIPQELCLKSSSDIFTRNSGYSSYKTDSFDDFNYSGSINRKSLNTDFGYKSQVKTNESKTKYLSGQTVRHRTFGKGMIVSVTPMSNDTLLEIAFEDVGTKKIMANFAKLEVL